MSSQVEGVSSAADLWSNFVQHRITHIQCKFYRGRPDDLLQACQKIDDELAAMHLAMSSLLMHRNTLAPISILPPEILTRIFQFHAADQPPSDEDQVDELGWIRVTHVCRLWRETALHDPAMWSDLTTDLGLRWLELMVERAKSMPLSYSQINCGDDSGKFLVHILPHLLFRLRSLSAFDTPNAIEHVLPLLTSSAPMLHTLKLTATSYYHRRITLPRGAFQGDLPVLRRLYLNNVCLSWTAPFLRDLTYLHIEQEKYHASPAIVREDDFFRALEAMPIVETLYLASVLPTGPGGTSANDRTVQLPCLQSLTLIDRGPRCLHVLKQLDIPPSCLVHLECVDYYEPHWKASLPLLCHQFPATQNPFHTLSVVYDGYSMNTIGLKLWRESNISGSEVFYPAQVPDLFMSVFISGVTEDESEYLPQPIEVMCDALPLNDIRAVIIRKCTAFVSTCIGWQHLSRNCPEVSHILLDCDIDVMDLCKMMLDDEAAQDVQQTGSTQIQPFLPNLKLLELESMDLRPCKARNGTIIEIGKVVVSALDTRRAREKAVSVVRLGKGCIVDTARLNALRDVVHVEYDPNTIQEIPKAPACQAQGFVYTSREVRGSQLSRFT